MAQHELGPLPPVPGFRFAALPAGIRADGRADLALAVADRVAGAAGLFTRNLVRAAPVELASARLRAGRGRAIVVNSGCANACTGAPGLEAAERVTAAVARGLGWDREDVLPASTGVIGRLLPADRIEAQVPGLVGALSPGSLGEFARAILTTDRWPKVAERALPGGGRVVAVGKGAGMIHPELGTLGDADAGTPHATMLVFVFTDAVADPGTLERALVGAAAGTFNATSVDGDTSTNDCVLALASGATAARPSLPELEATLGAAFEALARSMVRDGEGAEHVVELRVRGLAEVAACRAVARTVATSLLVKTALHGRDANWGRLLAAAGRAGVGFDPGRARITIAGVEIVRAGVSVGAEAEARAEAAMAAEDYVIELELGDSSASARYLTSDLGHGYVDVNASYRT
ncbi:MAG: bifunctional glutamate N-acetyltransferase/amino-acid acetyltransferase ArgJ [Polyangiaceae bacterium]|nr:bifunctional glutamate N-acetyltransferase/amino-acid acetyltransferase ArgJ [Polyangiaceae bacterium]